MELDLFDKLGDKFFMRFLIDLIAVSIIVFSIYLPNYKKRDHLFTFFMFNVVIYIITYLLSKVEMSFGAAFGLFAVFSLLRYRTENISEKDMTYLLLFIAMGLINSTVKGTYFESVILNGILMLAAWVLDGGVLVKNEKTQTILYEKIENVRDDKAQVLMDDLKLRTGLNIHKVSVVYIDFVKDSAELKIYYY
jgi:thiol:disulfide interchange protein